MSSLARAERSTAAPLTEAAADPAFCASYVQRRATSRRRQRSNVSGLTGTLIQACRGSARLTATSRARSADISAGRSACRRRTPTRGGAPRSPAPSTEPNGQAMAPARTDCGRRGRRTTRACAHLQADHWARAPRLLASRHRLPRARSAGSSLRTLRAGFAADHFKPSSVASSKYELPDFT